MGDIKVFVYGTLKKDFPNHYLLEGKAEYLGAGSLADKYPLVIASRYNVPYILDCKDTGHHVEGEVYSLTPETLGYVDALESHPQYYHRVTVPVLLAHQIVETFVYLLHNYKPEMLELPRYTRYDSASAQEYVPPSTRPQGVYYWSDVKLS